MSNANETVQEENEPSSCGFQGYSGTTQYPDLMCIDGRMIDQDGDGPQSDVWYPPCPKCEPEKYAEWQQELKDEQQ